MTSDDLSVFLCTDYLPPSGGGVEVVVETLARQLRDSGVDVAVFALEAADEPALAALDGIDIYQASTIDLTRFIGLQTQLSPAAFAALYRAIERHDPDIVHVHNRFFFTSLVGGLLKATRLLDVPLVTTLHLSSVHRIGGTAGSMARVYEHTVGRMLLGASDAVIAVSGAVAEHGRTIGASPERTHVLYNGVDTATFRPPETAPDGNEVLFVGRLIRNKGPHVFLDALPAVLAHHPDASARIVGVGPMRERLEGQAAERGIGEQVRFCGRVESVAEAMREATVFCRPSFSEGLPLTLLEAMATGLPAVVTPVAGVPEVISDGETGLLVDSDPESLSQSLRYVLDTPETASAIGRAAREYMVENHSWERRTENVIDIYNRVLEDRQNK